ncbi:MAG TPA: Sua5/YciO/YrdC/YwlC family protein, partial [Syntrophorhabdaceae bacterium]|nr:Sua5/YciO/YrdC/YwlC family protein [Syntrophorhabdaceae bacterium]
LKRYLPGPFTFVLLAKKIIPKLLMTERKEVGVRIPAHPTPTGIAELAGHPIINTTARISGQDALTDPVQIEKAFKGTIDIVIDGGTIVGDPSTIVRLIDDKVEIVRQGKGII